jgi:uncharacterized protein (DUF433 family)
MKKHFEYITADPNILNGKPILKGTRISVDFILQLMASGANVDGILQNYPRLNREAVVEALLYASEVVKNELNIEIKAA